MPRKINKSPISGKSAQPQISAKLLEALTTGPVTNEQFEYIFQSFNKAFIKRDLSAEMSHHLGYSPGQVKPDGATNLRIGSSAKSVITDTGTCALNYPLSERAAMSPNSSASMSVA